MPAQSNLDQPVMQGWHGGMFLDLFLRLPGVPIAISTFIYCIYYYYVYVYIYIYISSMFIVLYFRQYVVGIFVPRSQLLPVPNSKN